ncbi:alpha/beta hydrolase-fold protein [Streptomyces sp. NPDC052496]|uniref:alpha/beta hydrolase n=1 Tax=Streptomyces sp. NPDC052496 TaxID=3154951 RepID=UPI003421D616
MGLTSKKVLLLAILFAVALFILTIWLWRRLSKRNWRAVLGRAGLLLATQLSIFALVALLANNSYLFYGSWAELFGAKQETVNSGPDGPKLKVLGTEHVGLPGGSAPSVAGRVEKVLLKGEKSKINGSAYVYLPPQYFQPEYAKKRFPTSVVLTGHPGNAKALYQGLRYPQTQHDLARKGKMQPTIMVMMSPTVVLPWDTECVDVPKGPQAETFFTHDVRQDMASHYRVGTDAKSWGVIGDSTGGYCALKIPMRHPKAFSTGVSLSGSYNASEGTSPTGDLFGGNKQLERENDLLWRQKNLPAPPVNLLVTSSKKGEENYKDTLKFIQQTKSPGRIASIILDSGSHHFDTWRREIPAALEWMSGHLKA